MVNKVQGAQTQLLKMLSDIRERYLVAQEIENRHREQGEFFNVFNIIGMRVDEVRLHSAMLAELLSPNGYHGLGTLFLRAFLDVIGVESSFIDYSYCNLDCKERYIGAKTETDGGRIDIIIEDGNHAIIIENKIYAPDQENQLLRYYNYGRKKFPNGFKLLYLTLNGDEPHECSLGGKSIDYQKISYKNEIIRWLEQCSDIASSKDNAKIVINQYCHLVKELTLTDMDSQYFEQLKAITLDPNNIISVGEILKIQDDWFSAVIDKYIWQPLKDYAKSKGMEYGEDDYCTWIYKPEWRYYGIFIDYDKGYYVGISYYKEPNRPNRLNKKDQRVLGSLRDKPCSEHPDWPYGWEYLNNKDWNYDTIENIVNGLVINEITQKFDEILEEIDTCSVRMP